MGADYWGVMVLEHPIVNFMGCSAPDEINKTYNYLIR
jgi:hypothetical protein